MGRIWKAGLVPAVMLGLACGNPSGASAETVAAGKWQPWIEFGGYLSSDKSRGEAALFLPFYQTPSSLFFGDIRGKLFSDDIREGNLAVGRRWMLENRWNAGLWGGYDVRRSEFGNTFHQLSGGIELLHPDYDLRINGYLPLNDKELISSSATAGAATTTGVALVGAALQMVTTTVTTATRRDVYELALGGGDAEVGFRVPLERAFGETFDPQNGQAELRLYGGGFYFDHPDAPDPMFGPKLRAELRIADFIPALPGSRLTLEAEYRYDDVREHDVEGGIRLRIPIGGGSRNARGTAQERRMVEALERDTDIVATSAVFGSSTVRTAATAEAVKNAQTDAVVGTVVEIDGASAGGLATAAAAAGVDGLVVARGGAGNIAGGTLAAGQAVVGGGGSFDVVGAVSNTPGTFVATGTAPTFTAAAGAVMTMATGTQLSGIGITGTAQIGVETAGASNVLLRDVAVAGLTNANPVGVRMTGGSNFTMTGGSISGITSTTSSAYGFLANVGASNITLEDVAISGLAGPASQTRFGVALSGTSGTADFTNVVMTLDSQSGNVADPTLYYDEIGYRFTNHAGGLVTISGGRIDNAHTGIQVPNPGVSLLKVANVAINGFRHSGIDIDNGSGASRVSLDNVTISRNPAETVWNSKPMWVANRNGGTMDLTVANSAFSNFHSLAGQNPPAIELFGNNGSYCANVSANTFAGPTAAERQTTVRDGSNAVSVVDATNFAANNTGGGLGTFGSGSFVNVAGVCLLP